MDKFCIYCRLAGAPTEENKKEMEQQFNALRHEADRLGMTVVDEICAYESGRLPDRDSINALIKGAEQGKYNCIFTKSISRLGRNTVEILEIADRFKACGLDVYTLQEGFLLRSPMNIVTCARLATIEQVISDKDLEEAKQILQEKGYDSDEADEILSDCYSDMQAEHYSKPLSWYIEQTEAKHTHQPEAPRF